MHKYLSSKGSLTSSKNLEISIGNIASKILVVNCGFILMQFLKICNIIIRNEFEFINTVRKKNK